MFGKKKKSPTVRIPASVLRKEAQKAAKKMLEAEKRKEKQKLLREKAKAKAKQKLEKKKAREKKLNEFKDTPIYKEIIGWTWIILGVVLVAIFFSSADLAKQIFAGFRWLFGTGLWLIPLILMAIGGIFIFTKNPDDRKHPFYYEWSPVRIISLLTFLSAILGIINLTLPQSESLALAETRGGIIGFTIGFFPREFLGDWVAGILLFGLAWITATIGFRIHWSEIFSRKLSSSLDSKCRQKCNELKIEDTTGDIQKKILDEAKAEIAKEKSAKKTSSRFQNELEILDTNTSTSKKSATNKLEKTEEEKIEEKMHQKLVGTWHPPTVDLLDNNPSRVVADERKLRESAEKIREKLAQFGIEVTMKSVHVGPTVTQFTLEPAAGVKLTKITSLKNDLALALAAENIRIEAPIRGKSLVGIEIPNEKRANVSMREIIESEAWTKSKDILKLAVGRDVSGKPIVVNLAKMPHLLMAGKTGSGKSVGMNAFLCSLLWNNSPEDLKLILIDPKRVELNRYKGLPHLLTPVIVEPEKSVSALAWAVAEMNRRYRMLSEAGVVNLDQYNEKFAEKKEPRIVIVIDELADLMMVAGKDVEAAVVRIAQLARAVGMHLIIATQRPSVDVVTGLIKANLPARIAFKVSSQIDSRTIIDGMGAESLLGLGDMLYLDGNSGNLTRIQGIYISNEEVSRLTNFFKLQFPEAIGNDEITQQSIEGMAKGKVLTAGLPQRETDDEKLDKLYSQAVEIVLQNKKASASFLQRRLEIGYARAARILDQMEERGIIGPSRGAKPREIYGQN